MHHRIAGTHVLLSLLLAGCQVDADGDGLSNAQEVRFGSDPDVPDTDGDGLDDLVEYELGTSPVHLDSDFDTYLDPWEVAEGTDPTDRESRIYQGFWPYNPDKHLLVEPGDSELSLIHI